MSSINTNLSAMTALQALKSTQNAMSKNQSQISTGLRVGEASHNASYWSIATKMKSDNGALGAVKDAIGQSVSMINTFTSANDKVLGLLNKLKDNMVAAQQPGANLDKINTEVQSSLKGLISTGESASINGQNWLTNTAAGATKVELVVSYNGTTGQVGKLEVDISKSKLFTVGADGLKTTAAGGAGLLDNVLTNLGAANALTNGKAAGADPVADPAVARTSASAIQGFLDTINKAIEDVTTSSSTLGASKAQLETQAEFISSLSDSLTAGVSAYIDADMNEASTRNQALQTQQQLGVQALSMANQNSQMILKLFQ